MSGGCSLGGCSLGQPILDLFTTTPVLFPRGLQSGGLKSRAADLGSVHANTCSFSRGGLESGGRQSRATDLGFVHASILTHFVYHPTPCQTQPLRASVCVCAHKYFHRKLLKVSSHRCWPWPWVMGQIIASLAAGTSHLLRPNGTGRNAATVHTPPHKVAARLGRIM